MIEATTRVICDTIDCPMDIVFEDIGPDRARRSVLGEYGWLERVENGATYIYCCDCADKFDVE